MGATAQVVINPSLYKSRASDPAKNLAPDTMVQNENNLMVVTPSSPVNNLNELIAYAKANPKAVTFAPPGAGSPAHLAGELMRQATPHNSRRYSFFRSRKAPSDQRQMVFLITFFAGRPSPPSCGIIAMLHSLVQPNERRFTWLTNNAAKR
ncbi:MAG: tripartite tricarboxylate transporter substrate-binding protein [Burkholderiales bacterium]